MSVSETIRTRMLGLGMQIFDLVCQKMFKMVNIQNTVFKLIRVSKRYLIVETLDNSVVSWSAL